LHRIVENQGSDIGKAFGAIVKLDRIEIELDSIWIGLSWIWIDWIGFGLRLSWIGLRLD
jgi:hypothetical protein